METFIGNVRNGATWIRDCLLDSPELLSAIDRLQRDRRNGIRHFSAIRRAVPLEQVRKMEAEISRLEDAADVELRAAPLRSES
jgi:hypothetical protein